MLPYSPLHHLLMRELNFPIVATSGNLSDEPICIDEHEALERLHGIADVFLVHDRPIVRHVDDSVVRVMCDREMILRRARGYAPLPIAVGHVCQTPNQGVSQKRPTILAVGAHLKNTVALKIDNNIFVSQHIGDLETKEAYAAFRRTCADLPRCTMRISISWRAICIRIISRLNSRWIGERTRPRVPFAAPRRKPLRISRKLDCRS